MISVPKFPICKVPKNFEDILESEQSTKNSRDGQTKSKHKIRIIERGATVGELPVD